MAFFKFLFYVLLYILIKIGDIVYSVLSTLLHSFLYPFTLLAKLFNNLSGVTKRSFFSRKKFPSRTKNTIRPNRETAFELFSKYVSHEIKFFSVIVNFLKLIFVGSLKELVSFFRFVMALLLFPLRVVLKRRQKRKYRKQTREVVVVARTTFLYKTKYIAYGALFAFVFFFLPASFFIFISDLPKLSNLSVNYIPKSTKILDRNGNLLFEIYANQNRTIVPLKAIPKKLQEATIAIEDKDFYKHGGFDIKGIARALYVDITKKDLQGGSTITQQLIKSALLTPEPTITRKVRELVLAFWAERKYTKSQILELYFNYVPYGGTAWGVEAASNIYFGKDASSLSLSESAYLAGLPQAPSQYSPFAGDGSQGKRRQKEVLNAMVEQGYITSDQAKQAYAEKLIFQSSHVPIQAPHFVMYVKDLLVRKYGLFEVERGGLKVTTSLDIDTQKMAEKIVSDEIDKDGYLGIGNGAALVTNPKNGDILAMVGSRDYFDSDHDGNVNITTSLRQPGSTIKLVTYTLALSKGMTEATILDDTPLTISYPGSPSYTPVNYDGRFHGKVPLRIAFANSFNIPAVRVAQKLGVDELVAFGKKMGISSWGSSDNYGLSITLGAAEVSMVDLATAYGTIANEGSKVVLDPIRQITDAEGKVIEQKNPTPEVVVSPGVAFIVSDILADNKARSIEFGTTSPLSVSNQRVSVKTGTTDNKRDNWTIGYTPGVLVATWVGNNDNTPLSQALASGITGAAPMWNRIMTNMLQGRDSSTPQVPEEVISRQCFGYTAYFIRGTDAKAPCRVFAPTPTPQQQ